LIRLLGAPVALLVDAFGLLGSALILRGISVPEQRMTAPGRAAFWADLLEGLRFVVRHRLLVALAVCVGALQMCHHAALVVQILFATRVLGMGEQAVGLSYVALGVGTITASLAGDRISRRIGRGPAWCWASRSPAAAGRCCRWRRSARWGGGLRGHAVPVRRRRGAGVHQLPGLAPGGDA
jgi:hypothetical protein